jgi:peptide deformylase
MSQQCSSLSILVLATFVAAYSPPGRVRAGHPTMVDDEVEVPPLRYLGDALLMTSQPATDIMSSHFTAQLDMLRRAMDVHGGIGIAAPQVGWWTRVFCFGIESSNTRYPAANAIPFSMWINPEIDTSACEETNWMWEGCLSVPGMRGWVERPSKCVLRGLDEHGVAKEVSLEGLAARIAQHEFDHLDGVLFPQRTPGRQFLVPTASFGDREQWAPGWPSEGSRVTALGELSPVR